MFGTLKCNADGKQPKLIECADGAKFFGSESPHRSACQNCRDRKLRCDRQKPSCKRCQNGGAKCIYLSPPERRRPASARGSTKAEIEGRHPAHTESADASGSTSWSSASSSTCYDAVGVGTRDEQAIAPIDHRPTSSALQHDPFQLSELDEFGLPTLCGLLDSPQESYDWTAMPLDPNFLVNTDLHGHHDTEIRVEDSSERDVLTDLFGMGVQWQASVTNTSGSSPISPRTQTSSSGTSSSSKCHCMERILERLDDLEVEPTGTFHSRITTQLALQRALSRECKSMLACAECRAQPSRITFLIITYGRLVEFCESIHTEYVEWRQIVSKNVVSGLCVGNFEVSSQDEISAVLRSLLSLALSDLTISISELASCGFGGVRDAHLGRLRNVQEKAKSIANGLRQWCESDPILRDDA